MNIINEETKQVPVDNVKPHPRNPREGDVGAIHQSIQENGFYGSLIVQKSTGYILAGNHRWIAATQQGYDTVPVTYVDVDDDHALRILLADNRTNDLASYNETELNSILKDLAESTGLAGTGYDGDDLDQLITDEDFDANAEWTGMPEYTQDDQRAYQTIKVHFINEEDRQAFADLIGQPLTEKTRSIWHPRQERENLQEYQYVNDAS